jgi:hypothetical protein
MLAPSEYGVLCEWFKFLTTSPKIDLGVDLIVYLRTSPEIAWERVKARARSEEKVILLKIKYKFTVSNCRRNMHLKYFILFEVFFLNI